MSQQQTSTTSSTLQTPYIPPLIKFTHEDLAAKGLRKRTIHDTAPIPPIHFTALEAVRDNRLLQLTGPSGAGKTAFAKYLHDLFSQDRDGAIVERAEVVRNEGGDVREERWDDGAESRVWYVPVNRVGSVVREIEGAEGDVLVVIDGIQGSEDGEDLAAVIDAVRERKNLRLLILRNSDTGRDGGAVGDVPTFELLPLLESQRRRVMGVLTGTDSVQITVGVGAAAALPTYFELAVHTRSRGDEAEALVDAWLEGLGDEATSLPQEAFESIQKGDNFTQEETKGDGPVVPQLSVSKAIRRLLAARHLMSEPLDVAVTCFNSSPSTWTQVLSSLSCRLSRLGKTNDLTAKLLQSAEKSAYAGSLLASDFIDHSSPFHTTLLNHMLAILGTDLPISQREKAARVLARLGDPRDLTALAAVPAGSVTLGSTSHPNSQPIHSVALSAFQIGIFPVVNRDYADFVHATNREWKSPDASAPEKQNVPATDLTWHDATAYCAWLTQKWRATGKIGANEAVRLPTEPEWEYAARGTQAPLNTDELVYPWGVQWQDDAVNFEENGFNRPVSVGLFPRGRSPFGCYDMAGNIWEWCSTLWGEDMATPEFKYPWVGDDGREAKEAREEVRRVLRGGCFSSAREKATATYRGSLEPSGFWRGNGFRVVVAPES